MSYLKDTLILSNKTIREVIRKLEYSIAKIACVINENDELLGVVTDGDVRRGLINGIGIDETVDKIMHKSPTVVQPGYKLSDIKRIMKEKKIYYVPVVENSVIVDLICPDDLSQITTKNNPVLLMAGGFGKRLGGLTNSCPKPLLKVGNKPILETIINRFKKNGFKNFYISVHYKAEMIKEYFGNGERLKVNIQYLEEHAPLGTAGPLVFLKNQTETILMMNGDVLTKVDFDNFLQFHKEHESDFTMCAREYGYQVPYGVIQSDGHQVLGIKEKPIQNFFVNAGVYAIEPSLISQIQDGEKIDMNIFIDKHLKDKKNIFFYPLHEYWQDIGQRENFDQAQEDYKKEFN